MESDLSVFHRIDDLAGVHPQRLINLVVRLGYYSGVVQARLRADVEAEDAVQPAVPGLAADRVVDSSSVALAVDPVLGGLIEIG